MSAVTCTPFCRSVGRRIAGGRGARGGFTLVEVLATIVLMGIVIPVALHGVTIATMAASSAKHRVEAAALADAKLQDVVVESLWQSGEVAGDFSQEGFSAYQWGIDANVVDTDLTEVSIRVTWAGRGGQQQELIVSTLVYTPSTTDSSTGATQ